MMEDYKGLPIDEAVEKYQRDSRKAGLPSIIVGFVILVLNLLPFIFGEKPASLPSFVAYYFLVVGTILGSGLIIFGFYELVAIGRDTKRARRSFISENDERLQDAFWKSGFLVVFIMGLLEINCATATFGLCDVIDWWPGVLIALGVVAATQILISLILYLLLRSGKL